MSLFSDGFEEPNIDSSDWNNNQDLLSRKANDDDNIPFAFKQIMQSNTNYRHDQEEAKQVYQHKLVGILVHYQN